MGSIVLATLLVIVVMLGALIVLNMLIGLLVNIVSEVNKKEKDSMAAEYVRSKITNLVVTTLDVENNGKISQQEFDKILTNQPLALAINEVGVDVVSLVDFSDILFKE